MKDQYGNDICGEKWEDEFSIDRICHLPPGHKGPHRCNQYISEQEQERRGVDDAGPQERASDS